MPQKNAPKCIQCENKYSPMWRNAENGQICQTCYEFNRNGSTKIEPADAIDTNENSNNGSGTGEIEKKLRKSTRTTRYKTRNTGNNTVNKSQPKGRNRRNIFKRNPTKTPVVTATTTSVESLFFNVNRFLFFTRDFILKEYFSIHRDRMCKLVILLH